MAPSLLAAPPTAGIQYIANDGISGDGATLAATATSTGDPAPTSKPEWSGEMSRTLKLRSVVGMAADSPPVTGTWSNLSTYLAVTSEKYKRAPSVTRPTFGCPSVVICAQFKTRGGASGCRSK